MSTGSKLTKTQTKRALMVCVNKAYNVAFAANQTCLTPSDAFAIDKIITRAMKRLG